jgi:cytochrome c
MLRKAASAALILFASAAASEADDAGQKLFKNHCGACHTLDAAAPPRQGPNLHAVFERKAGALEGFKYSDGLKAAGWQWTPEQLDLWLIDPKGLVPGTLMSAYKQKDPEKRKAIIDYLVANSSK